MKKVSQEMPTLPVKLNHDLAAELLDNITNAIHCLSTPYPVADTGRMSREKLVQVAWIDFLMHESRKFLYHVTEVVEKAKAE